jgi:hypothetical protein
MTLTNAHKSLLITFFLSATVVVLTFSFHLKRANDLVAETFFEMLPEEDEFSEEKEELDDILESFNKLTTNKAFNQNKAFDDLDDEEFESTLEKIRNRSNNENAAKQESIEKNSEPSNDNSETFNKINEIIKKRSGNDGNKLGTSSYSLVDRELQYLPTPVYLCENGGKIVVNIKVNAQGAVTEAVYNGASTTDNGCMVDHAIEYALQAQFDENNSKPSQLGSITFYFIPKRK